METTKPTYIELENQVAELNSKLENSEKHPFDLFLIQSIFESPNNLIFFSLDKNYCYTSFTKFHQAIIKIIWGVDIQKGTNMLNVILCQNDREKAKSNFDRVLNGESFILSEEYGNNELYPTFYDSCYYPVKNSESSIIGLSAFVVDASKRKQIELELMSAKDKAEESDRLISAFLANISHEIRTPMNGILGFADLLKKSGLTSDQQQEYIGILKISGVRMLNIINDIVDISKIEAGLILPNITETDIHLLSEFVFKLLNPEAAKKSIRFVYKNGMDSKEYMVKTDREKLYAILINLLNNAIKFTDEGSIEFGYTLKPGSLLSGFEIVPVAELAGTELEFYVKDSGVGIPTSRQHAIFDRFIQADSSDQRAFQGAGLGLSISKSYVEMLGGKLWVESEEGKGSTFFFTIPVNSPKHSESGNE